MKCIKEKQMRSSIQQEIVIYGDSISTASHGDGGYQKALKQYFPAHTVYNHAVSSSGLSTVTPNSLVEILSDVEKIHPNSSVIILWHGTNDWYWGAELGRLSVPDKKNFYGAMDLCVGILQEACPHAKIIWPTPIWRFENPAGCEQAGNAWVTQNKAGITQQEITSAILCGANYYGFIPLQMHKICVINHNNANYLLEDNVHPNNQGYSIISAPIISAITQAIQIYN